MGAVTPIGNTVQEFWDGIRNGNVGIGEISKFDTKAYQVKLAAEVKGFDPKERMDFKSAKTDGIVFTICGCRRKRSI